MCVVFGPRPHYKNRVWLGRTAQVITMVLVVVLASKMVGAVASLAKLVSLVTGDIKTLLQVYCQF